MNILIIDDSIEKVGVINQYINSIAPDALITHVNSAHDGFKVLLETRIDLLLLDIRLPFKSGLEPVDEASIWLLKEIAKKIPQESKPLVIGMTQYPDSQLAAQETFKEYLWSIALVSPIDQHWQRQLTQAIRITQSKDNQHRFTELNTETDVAIVAALRFPEYQAILNLFPDVRSFVLKETNEHWTTARIEGKNGKQTRIIAACADEMGMCAMTGLVTRVVLASRPKFLILAGIMGGNSKRVGMGDVIAIDESWDYRAGKITETGFESDTRSQRGSQILLNTLRGLVTDTMLTKFWNEWSGEKPRSFPRLHVGPVACSPAVVADAKVFEEIEGQKRRVLGVEMEAYGCYDAARRLGSVGPDVLCIKSICDLGDKEKSDQYQAYCSYMSARVSIELINTLGAIRGDK